MARADNDNRNFAIGMWADPKLAVSNVTIRNIAGCGIYDITSPATSPNPNFSQPATNTFTNVTGGDFCYQ